VQFALPGQTARYVRYVLCGIYGAIALTALIRNRRHILPTLTAPFRQAPDDDASRTSPRGSPPRPHASRTVPPHVPDPKGHLMSLFDMVNARPPIC
jgi:hypothetical protein